MYLGRFWVVVFFLLFLVVFYKDEIKPNICQTPSEPSDFFQCYISVQQDTDLDNIGPIVQLPNGHFFHPYSASQVTLYTGDVTGEI